MPMPSPIELPPDTLQVSDDGIAQEVITAPEVNPSLFKQHHADRVNRPDEDKSMIVQPPMYV
jgi:hypothetical protein